DHLHLVRRRRRAHPDDAAEPRHSQRLLPARGAVARRGRPPSQPEGPRPAEGAARTLTRRPAASGPPGATHRPQRGRRCLVRRMPGSPVRWQDREMAVTVHEVERKYQVNVEYRMPDLGELPGVRAVEAPREQELVATYFDTPDLRLAVHSVTLRRRTGGDDAGWHLKLPVGGDERTEIQLPLGRGARTTPPRELQERIEVYVRGGELVPVAELVPRRIGYRRLGARGAVLAEVADATVPAPARTAGTAPEAGPRTATRTAPRLPAGTAPAAVNGSRAATETLTRAGSGTAAATGGAGTAQAPAIPEAAVRSWRELEVGLVRRSRPHL